ncbi:MAG TPA: hypothetical protein PKK06_08885 [Phycisphaerae bacterium]|nr:hypothetical protein [Phycisphaerae bacterium]HNU45314.1 hypothetical protein [Phycisphaerae bacterium]
MTKPSWICGWGMLLAGVLPVAWGQTAPATPPERAAAPSRPAATDRELEGFWPSPRQMELFLLRWTDEATGNYDLDDEQLRRIREQVLQRWPAFFQEHRAQLQPLVNEWFEMRIDMQPPGKERVQAWTERALPMFDEFRTQLKEGADEFRKVLKPTQRARFELEMLQFGVGMQVAEAKLKQWAQGEYREEEFWDPPRSERQRRRAAREGEQAAGDQPPQPPPDQIAQELDRWERYVREFIELYGLDDTQQTTARSCLVELKERAVAHRDRNRDRIDQLEHRVTSGEGDETEIKRQLEELYGPIDTMFTELKSRLEALLTSDQRERAGQAALEKEEQRAEERRQRIEQRRAERERAAQAQPQPQPATGSTGKEAPRPPEQAPPSDE